MVFGLVSKNNLELATIISKLYIYFYRDKWKIVDVRTILRKRKGHEHILLIKVGRLIKYANFNRGETLYARIENGDIVLRKDWYGYPVNIVDTKRNIRLFLSPLFMALGYKHGDNVVVLVKDGEIRLKNLQREIEKLKDFEEKIRKEVRGETDVGETNQVSDYFIQNT